MQEIDLISLFAALLMFTGTIVFKGQRETFAGWDSSTAEVQLATIVQKERDSSAFRITQADLPAQFALQNNLTPRETQILLLLIEGRNNPYIRENLNVSNNTLKTHLRNIYRKLSIDDRQELLDVYNQFKEDFYKAKSSRIKQN